MLSYVAKYERKRQKYGVRVCCQHDVTVREKAEISKRLKQTDDNEISSLPNRNSGIAATISQVAKRVSLRNVTSSSSNSSPEESTSSDVSTVAEERALNSEKRMERKEFLSKKRRSANVKNANIRIQNKPLLNVDVASRPLEHLRATAVKRLFTMSNKTVSFFISLYSGSRH